MVMVMQVLLALYLGAWFVTLDPKNAYYHIQIAPRYHHFLANQVRETVLQYIVLPSSLNIAPWVFTKMTKSVPCALSDLSVKTLMYIDDWLIQALDHPQHEMHTAQRPDSVTTARVPVQLCQVSLHSVPDSGQDGDSVGFSEQHSTLVSRKCLSRANQRAPCPVLSGHVLATVGEFAWLSQQHSDYSFVGLKFSMHHHWHSCQGNHLSYLGQKVTDSISLISSSTPLVVASSIITLHPDSVEMASCHILFAETEVSDHG